MKTLNWVKGINKNPQSYCKKYSLKTTDMGLNQNNKKHLLHIQLLKSLQPGGTENKYNLIWIVFMLFFIILFTLCDLHAERVQHSNGGGGWITVIFLDCAGLTPRTEAGLTDKSSLIIHSLLQKQDTSRQLRDQTADECHRFPSFLAPDMSQHGQVGCSHVS